jgi:hypothetical protein
MVSIRVASNLRIEPHLSISESCRVKSPKGLLYNKQADGMA